ncbi:MAG: DMT family transporter [Holophaga sp.]|nr:DMT family transporter [Holophaga sp.]
MLYLGEFASILTAFCWSANSVCFTIAGRRVGSATVNVVRLWIALLAMILLHLIMVGTFFPNPEGWRWAYLGISGLIGFALGDAVLFEALVLLGPRLTMLIMTLWPVFAAVLAWVFLGQTMSLPRILAMAVTLGGIALVVGDHHSAADGDRPKKLTLGILLALGGALGQAIGFLLSKYGLEGNYSPISANLIRVAAGTLAISLWLLFRGHLLENFSRLKDGRASMLIALGAVSGPVVGVVLSLYAIGHARFLGVASTLMSLSPVILLPVSVLLFKEKVTGKAILGTVITLTGAAALFFL